MGNGATRSVTTRAMVRALVRALVARTLAHSPPACPQVTFLLPVNEKEISFMATEPVDYPCSLQKEFDTAW